MRLSDEQRAQLRAMGFTHAVVIVKDISVQMIGSVQSVHSHPDDAAEEARRLSEMYAAWDDDGFDVEEI